MRGFRRSLGAFRNRQIRRALRRPYVYNIESSAPVSIGCLIPMMIIGVLLIMVII